MQCPQESAISLEEHPEILSLLQNDGFRRELKAHPLGVLGRYGLQLKMEDIPRAVSLPEASDIPSPSGAISPAMPWLGLIWDDPGSCQLCSHPGEPTLDFVIAQLSGGLLDGESLQTGLLGLLFDLSQTLALVATELNLGTFFSAALDAPEVDEILGLDGYREGAVAVGGCGVKPSAGPDHGLPFRAFVPRKTVL